MKTNAALIFSPLKFRYLEVKNRLFRSNLAGMFDEYKAMAAIRD